MAEKPKRRDLNFEKLVDIKTELRHLLESGYTANGKWNLSQTCLHLNDWMSYPMDGYPTPPMFMRILFWGMRISGSAKKMARGILADGFKPGLPTAPQTVHQSDEQTDAAAVAILEKTIDRFSSHNGDFYASPLFGATDPPTQEKVQRLHAAHHLGFLEPKS